MKLIRFFKFFFVFWSITNVNLTYSMIKTGQTVAQVTTRGKKNINKFKDKVGKSYGENQFTVKKPRKTNTIKNIVTENNNTLFNVKNMQEQSSYVIENIKTQAKKTSNPAKFKKISAEILPDISIEKRTALEEIIIKRRTTFDLLFQVQPRTKRNIIERLEVWIENQKIEDITPQELYDSYNNLKSKELQESMSKKGSSKKTVQEQLIEKTKDFSPKPTQDVIQETAQNLISLKETQELGKNTQHEESSSRITDTYNALENARKQSEKQVPEISTPEEVKKEEIKKETENKELTIIPKNFFEDLINQDPTVESIEDAQIVSEIDTAIENKEFTKEEFLAENLKNAITTQDPAALKIINTYNNVYVTENSKETMDIFKEQFPELDFLTQTDTTNAITDESGKFLEIIKNDPDKTTIIHNTNMSLNETTAQINKKLEKIINFDVAEKQQAFETNIKNELLGIEAPAEKIEIEEIIEEKTPTKTKSELEREGQSAQEHAEEFQKNAEKEALKLQEKKALEDIAKDFSKIEELDLPNIESKKITETQGEKIIKPEAPIETVQYPQTLKEAPKEHIPGKKATSQEIIESSTSKKIEEEESKKFSVAEKRETKELPGKFEQVKKIESNVEKSLGTKTPMQEKISQGEKKSIAEIKSKNLPSQKELPELNELKQEFIETQKNLEIIGDIIYTKTGQEVQKPQQLEIVSKTTNALKEVLSTTTQNIANTLQNAITQNKTKELNTLAFEKNITQAKNNIEHIKNQTLKKIEEVPEKNTKKALESAVDIMIKQTNDSLKNIENSTKDTILKIKQEMTPEMTKDRLMEKNKRLMQQANEASRLLEAEVEGMREENIRKEEKKSEQKKAEKEQKAGEKIIEKTTKETKKEKIEETGKGKTALGVLGLLGLVGTTTKEKEEAEEITPLTEEEKEMQYIKEMIMKEQQPNIIVRVWNWLKSIFSRFWATKSEFDTIQDEIEAEKLIKEFYNSEKTKKTQKYQSNKPSEEHGEEFHYSEHELPQAIEQPIDQSFVDNIKKDTQEKYEKRKKIMDEQLKNIDEKLAKKIDALIQKKMEHGVSFGGTGLKDYAQQLGPKKQQEPNIQQKNESSSASYYDSSYPSYTQPSFVNTQDSNFYDFFTPEDFANPSFDFAKFDILSDYDEFTPTKEFNVGGQEKKLETKTQDTKIASIKTPSALETSTETKALGGTSEKSAIQSKAAQEKEKAELLKAKNKEMTEEAEEIEKASEEKPLLPKKHYTPYIIPAIVFMAVSCALLYYWFM